MKELQYWTERDYWQWLLGIPGLYRSNLMVLLKYFETPQNIFRSADRELDVFSAHGMKWIEKLRSTRTFEQAELTEKQMMRSGTELVLRTDALWPENLRHIADPPYGLFVRGTLPDPSVYSAAVVGARSCTPYGRAMAKEIGAAAAAAGIQVISGMALGIDGFAQKACIESGGRSFAVLGCGAEQCYPREHISLYEDLRLNGGVLSEYPCGTAPLPVHFPMRNRIISGLADAVIVVEAREKSGSLITADLALEQGRDVYAVPGRSGDVLSGGCNRLIAAGGAGIVVSLEQLMEELLNCALMKGKKCLISRDKDTISGKFRNVTLPKQNRFIKDTLAPDEELVYSFLDLSPEGTDELSVKTGLDIIRLGSALAGLIYKGGAEEIGQNQYIRR